MLLSQTLAIAIGLLAAVANAQGPSGTIQPPSPTSPASPAAPRPTAPTATTVAPLLVPSATNLSPTQINEIIRIANTQTFPDASVGNSPSQNPVSDLPASGSDSPALSTGTIIGIVLGSLVGLFFIVFAVISYIGHSRTKKYDSFGTLGWSDLKKRALSQKESSPLPITRTEQEYRPQQTRPSFSSQSGRRVSQPSPLSQVFTPNAPISAVPHIQIPSASLRPATQQPIDFQQRQVSPQSPESVNSIYTSQFEQQMQYQQMQQQMQQQQYQMQLQQINNNRMYLQQQQQQLQDPNAPEGQYYY